MGGCGLFEGWVGVFLLLFQNAGLHFEIKRLVKHFILWLL